MLRLLQDAVLPRLRRKQLFEPQAPDPPLLFRRDGQYRGGVILKTPFEDGKHLLGRLAGGANEYPKRCRLPSASRAKAAR